MSHYCEIMPIIPRSHLLLLLTVQNTVVAFAPGPFRRQHDAAGPCRVDTLRTLVASHESVGISNGKDEDGDSGHDSFIHSRRMLLVTLSFLPATTAHATTGSMKTSQYAGKISARSTDKIKPQAAFEGLIKAREELQTAQMKYLKTKDYDGLRDYLEEAENINNFESNALAILASKKLE